MASLYEIQQQRRRQQQSGPAGTLQSNNLFYQPGVPAQSQALGMQGTDGRAYTRTVDDNELSSNRLNEITNRGGLYMENAARRGLETANRRGLLNSSIASGAAERSALEAATPLAMQEAAAFQAAQQENLGYLNQNLMQERQIANTMLGQQRDLADSAANRSANAANQRAQIEAQLRAQREQLAFQGEQAGLDRSHQIGMSDMEWQQNMATLGYQYDFQSREADRDVYRNIALQDNQFSNQRYNTAYQAILDGQLGQYNSAFGLMQQILADDPPPRPPHHDGLLKWMNTLSSQSIGNIINQFLPNGG